MDYNSLCDQMMSEKFGILIESESDAARLDEISGAYDSLEVLRYYQEYGLRIVVCDRSRYKFLYTTSDVYMKELSTYCNHIRTLREVLDGGISIETLDGLI